MIKKDFQIIIGLIFSVVFISNCTLNDKSDCRMNKSCNLNDEELSSSNNFISSSSIGELIAISSMSEIEICNEIGMIPGDFIYELPSVRCDTNDIGNLTGCSYGTDDDYVGIRISDSTRIGIYEFLDSIQMMASFNHPTAYTVNYPKVFDIADTISISWYRQVPHSVDSTIVSLTYLDTSFSSFELYGAIFNDSAYYVKILDGEIFEKSFSKNGDSIKYFVDRHLHYMKYRSSKSEYFSSETTTVISFVDNDTVIYRNISDSTSYSFEINDVLYETNSKSNNPNQYRCTLAP
jgi:hypothetical protein